MVNTIKSKVIEILKENQSDYTSKQLDYIIYCCEFLAAHNIKYPEKVIMMMWVNHLLVFLKRLENKEELKLEGLELMFVELSLESVALSRKMLLKVEENFNLKVSESEVFLIATHMENIINQA